MSRKLSALNFIIGVNTQIFNEDAEAMRYNHSECFGHWILKFEIYLRFGAWDLGFIVL